MAILSHHPLVFQSDRPMIEPKRLAKRVLLIGWDAADWKLIDKYLAEGAMPHMRRFLDRGARGNLATLKPVLSPMLWNSIGTGKRAYKHGIHGFTEPMPDGKGVRPSSSTTRKCKALWNILSQEGMTTNVVSWFVGHPAEPINGICISDLFQKVPLDKKNPQHCSLPPLPDGCIFPGSQCEKLAKLRVHPLEVTAEAIKFFIPQATKIDQEKDPRLQMFAKLYAEMLSVHNAATYAIQQNDWDFMGVYYDSIDHFGHGFMEYHPPRMAHVSEKEYEIYRDVMASCYKFHDLMLGRLMELAGEDTTLILCSDHGYHCDHLRPRETPTEPGGPAVWHRDQGIIAMAGPGIKKGEKIYGANLLDIAPTVLNLLGLPAGEDMDGKPMAHVIGDQWWHPPKMISSWEDVPGEAGMHPKDEQQDPFATREALRQLVELGYIEEPDENQEKAARDASREANYNLARACQDGGLLKKAAGHLEKLYQDSPEQTRFGLELARVYLKQGRFEETRSVAEGLLTMIEKRNLTLIEQLNEALRKIDEQPGEVIATAKEQQEKRHRKQVDAEETQIRKEKREPRNIEPLTPLGKEEFLAQRRGQLQETVDKIRHYNVRAAPTVCLLLGRLEAMDGNFNKALTYLDKAEQAEPRLPGLHLQLAQTYLRMRRNDEAVRACEKALEIDPDNAQAHEVLAAVLARLKRHEEAADHALSAVELIHNMPRAHLRLGATLTRLGLYEKAVEAFQTSLKLAPNTPAAHRYLATIYRTKLGRRDLASTHSFKLKMLQDQNRMGRNPAAEPKNSQPSHPKPVANTVAISSKPGLSVDQNEVITIVTGLPRSGTSMMMQMLVAGGMTPLTDGKREADTSNPEGYYEYDKAKQLGSNAGWISEGKGKVVKIVAQLLPLLPSKIDGTPAHYRIVFMERALEEVVSSQRTMLDRQQRKGAELDQARLAEVFLGQLQNIHTVITDRGIPCLRVQHAGAIRDPLSVANRLNRFFDKSLDTNAMAVVVDPTLYRERGKN